MKPGIAFVHTSPVHVATFQDLMLEIAPGVSASHVVHEDLLADAQREGVEGAPLIGRIRKAMEEAGAGGARVVMCTCSTIGGVAEGMETGGAFVAARIDRAMADTAVAKGQPILMVAALESTLAPTLNLLRASASKLGTHAEIETLVVRDAWPHFLAGERAAFIDSIVQAIVESRPTGKVVVLAQASMAPAAGPLAQLGITALSSPRLGVERALALLT